VRVRVVLGVALAIVAGALALDNSGRAQRLAGSDHVAPDVFSATVPGGGLLCQPVAPVPDDAARAVVRIGTYGRPVPILALRFLAPTGELSAYGTLPAGAHEGDVSIPLRHVRGAPQASRFCLRVGDRSRVVLAGFRAAPNAASERVNGRPQGGFVSLIYYRAGRDSWWSLLPRLDHRFGLGKAAIFGDWTLPVCVVLLLCCWVAVVRLLLRQLP
jgi:hypothetical protein